jgi:hypothetical protein
VLYYIILIGKCHAVLQAAATAVTSSRATCIYRDMGSTLGTFAGGFSALVMLARCSAGIVRCLEVIFGALHCFVVFCGAYSSLRCFMVLDPCSYIVDLARDMRCAPTDQHFPLEFRHTDAPSYRNMHVALTGV